MNPTTYTPTSDASPPFPWLVADIGGSNARFAWVTHLDAISHVRTLSVNEYASPIEASEQYLRDLSTELGAGYQAPRCAAFAVATAVNEEQIRFTNSHWNFTKSSVKAALGLERFLVINDFEALALSLPKLQANQLRSDGAPPLKQGTLAVIGPGTGLGVGSVIQTAHGWVALPGEGGHTTLAATDEFESAILSQVRKEYSHISAERFLSGIGIPVLYRAIAQTLKVDPNNYNTETIVEKALTGLDPVCVKTLDVFCALLGSFAGNVALIVGARSGVYIGGGIVPRLGDFFFNSRFREKFNAKGRLSSYLSSIPVALITDTLAALSGAALAIEQSHVEQAK